MWGFLCRADRFAVFNPTCTAQQELIARGREDGISHVLLVILSSREHSGPVTLGEERMMTQMSGTTFDNLALAEVALLDLVNYAVTFDHTGISDRNA